MKKRIVLIGITVSLFGPANPSIADSQICGFEKSVAVSGAHYSTSNPNYCGFSLVLDPFNKMQLTYTTNYYFKNFVCSGDGIISEWTCDEKTRSFRTEYADDDGQHVCYLRSLGSVANRVQVSCYLNSSFSDSTNYYRDDNS